MSPSQGVNGEVHVSERSLVLAKVSIRNGRYRARCRIKVARGPKLKKHLNTC